MLPRPQGTTIIPTIHHFSQAQMTTRNGRALNEKGWTAPVNILADVQEIAGKKNRNACSSCSAGYRWHAEGKTRATVGRFVGWNKRVFYASKRCRPCLWHKPLAVAERIRLRLHHPNIMPFTSAQCSTPNPHLVPDANFTVRPIPPEYGEHHDGGQAPVSELTHLESAWRGQAKKKWRRADYKNDSSIGRGLIKPLSIRFRRFLDQPAAFNRS